MICRKCGAARPSDRAASDSSSDNETVSSLGSLRELPAPVQQQSPMGASAWALRVAAGVDASTDVGTGTSRPTGSSSAGGSLPWIAGHEKEDLEAKAVLASAQLVVPFDLEPPPQPRDVSPPPEWNSPRSDIDNAPTGLKALPARAPAYGMKGTEDVKGKLAALRADAKAKAKASNSKGRSLFSSTSCSKSAASAQRFRPADRDKDLRIAHLAVNAGSSATTGTNDTTLDDIDYDNIHAE